MSEWFVNYTVRLPPNCVDVHRQAGPFPSQERAELHASDIRGYAYISQVFMTQSRHLERELVSYD